jgi:DNA-binding transcriptional MerR regulator
MLRNVTFKTPMQSLIKISDLCKIAGVTPRTVRHYLAENLIKPVDTTEGGRNSYSRNTAQTIKAIKIFQETGLSLKQIKRLFHSAQSPSPTGKYLTSHLRAAVITAGKSLERRIEELRGAHERIAAVVQETSRCDACAGTKCATCPSLSQLRTLGIIQ